MRKILFFLLVIVIAKSLAQDIKKTQYKTLLEIGQNFNENVVDNDYVFGSIKGIQTDYKNNIYLYDKLFQKIKVFDDKGKLIQQFGTKGKGPGEFMDVKAIYINSNDELLTFDGTNKSISVFNLEGKLLKSIIISDPRLLDMITITEYKNDYIVFSGTKENNKLFYIVSKSFDSIIYSFDFNLFNLNISKQIEIAPYYIFPSSILAKKDDIYFAKIVYDGTIYKLIYNNNEWKTISKIKGFTKSSNPYLLLKEKDFFNSKTQQKFTIEGAHLQEAIKLNNISRGLYSLKNNKFIHLIETYDKYNKYYLIKIYDKNFKLEKVYEFDKIKSVEGAEVLFPFMILHKDKEDNFYVYDKSKGYAVIKKIKFQFE